MIFTLKYKVFTKPEILKREKQKKRERDTNMIFKREKRERNNENNTTRQHIQYP
jgi:hypothetical protein